MTTYPRPSDPVNALTKRHGTTEAHSHAHGRTLDIWDNVMRNGADPTGTYDSWEAIQRTIDEACGDTRDYTTGTVLSSERDPVTGQVGGVGAGSGRLPTTGIYIPPGDFWVSRSIEVRSVEGLHVRGAGMMLTHLRASAGMGIVVDLNGFKASSWRDMTITSTTPDLEIGILLSWYWDQAYSYSSSAFSRFEDLYLEGNRSRVGIGLAVGINNDYDVSSGSFTHIRSTGNASDTDAWAATSWGFGVVVGDGLPANNLDHTFESVNSLGWHYGFGIRGSTALLNNCELGTNEVDIYHTGGSAGPLAINNTRSERSGVFLYDEGGPTQVQVNNLLWHASNGITLNATSETWAFIRSAGSFSFRDIHITAQGFLSFKPKILLGDAGALPDPLAAICHLHVDGATIQNTPCEDFVQSSYNYGTYTVQGYNEWSSATGLVKAQQGILRGRQAYPAARIYIEELFGEGSPEGVQNTLMGSTYVDVTNGIFYIKTINGGDTGWKPLHSWATSAANPDTSGAILADLETEVNQLKAALRTAGVIAT